MLFSSFFGMLLAWLFLTDRKRRRERKGMDSYLILSGRVGKFSPSFPTSLARFLNLDSGTCLVESPFPVLLGFTCAAAWFWSWSLEGEGGGGGVLFVEGVRDGCLKGVKSIIGSRLSNDDPGRRLMMMMMMATRRRRRRRRGRTLILYHHQGVKPAPVCFVVYED